MHWMLVCINLNILKAPIYHQRKDALCPNSFYLVLDVRAYASYFHSTLCLLLSFHLRWLHFPSGRYSAASKKQWIFFIVTSLGF